MRRARSSTAVGVKCVDGVVLAVEKSLVSKMMVQNTHKRIFHLDEHIGMAVSGVQADARNVMNRGRGEATQYRSTYGDPIPGDVMATRLAGYMHLHTMYWWLRPFGTSVLIGSYDQEGPQLHDIDPSGLSYVRSSPPSPVPLSTLLRALLFYSVCFAFCTAATPLLTLVHSPSNPCPPAIPPPTAHSATLPLPSARQRRRPSRS